VGTTANVQTTQHIRDVRPGLVELDPDVTPFIQILQAEGSEAAQNFKVEWNEIGGDFNGAGYSPQVDAVNGTTGTGTSCIVDNGAYFNVGDVVKVARTAELMRVTAISTNTLTVTRGFGSTSTAALADNDDLFIIAGAFAEGGNAANALTHQEIAKYNYTEIVKHAASQSKTQQAVANYTGDARMREREKIARKHKEALERTSIFGERSRDASDTGAPINSTGGILYWATANGVAVTGALTEPTLETFLEGVFSHTSGGMQRTFFCGPRVVSILNQISAGRLNTTPGEEVYGVRCKTWASAHGDLMIVKHRFLETGAAGGLTTQVGAYGGYGLALDMKNLKYRPLRDTALQKDIQVPENDYWKDQYLTEFALEFQLPAAHGVLTGVNT
jgi:hypothetical protein